MEEVELRRCVSRSKGMLLLTYPLDVIAHDAGGTLFNSLWSNISPSLRYRQADKTSEAWEERNFLKLTPMASILG